MAGARPTLQTQTPLSKDKKWKTWRAIRRAPISSQHQQQVSPAAPPAKRPKLGRGPLAALHWQQGRRTNRQDLISEQGKCFSLRVAAPLRREGQIGLDFASFLSLSFAALRRRRRRPNSERAKLERAPAREPTRTRSVACEPRQQVQSEQVAAAHSFCSLTSALIALHQSAEPDLQRHSRAPTCCELPFAARPPVEPAEQSGV